MFVYGYDNFVDVLKAVFPLVGKGTHTDLDSVCLHRTDDELLFLSSDRYVMGVGSAPVLDVSEPSLWQVAEGEQALLSADKVKMFLSFKIPATKAQRRRNPDWYRVVVSPTAVKIEIASDHGVFQTLLEVPTDAGLGSYPADQVRALAVAPEPDYDHPGGGVSYWNVEFLARLFGAVKHLRRSYGDGQLRLQLAPDGRSMYGDISNSDGVNVLIRQMSERKFEG